MLRPLFLAACLVSVMTQPPLLSATLVIAHRGDSFAFPENTLPGLNSAVEKKADLVELDSQLTKDGHLVVFHDGLIDKKTNEAEIFGATGRSIADLTLDQVRSLDHGAWKGPAFKGTPIATLEEALQAIQCGGGVTLLERKTGTALQHAKLVENLGYVNDLVVQAFDWEFLAAMRTWNPNIRLGALGGEKVTPERLEDLKRTEIPLAVWDHEELNETTVALFRQYGFELWSYTINEPAEWERLVKLGIDGIITDKPAELREWLANRESR